MSKFYSTGQVAKLCGVAVNTVVSWCNSGKLPGFRIPGSSHRRIEHDQLVKFMRDNGIPLGELAPYEVTAVTETMTATREASPLDVNCGAVQ